MERLSPDGRALRTTGGWLVRCPGHRDDKPSLSVGEGTDGRVLVRCFAGCSPEAITAALGLTVRDLFTGAPGSRAVHPWRPLPPRPAPTDTRERKAKREGWPDFVRPTAEELRRLADLRCLSFEGLALAVRRGLLWSCDYREARCWAVADSSRRAAQVRRLDGEPFEGGMKARTLPGSMATWPVGLPEAALCDVLLCEGAPDLLAAHHFIWAEDREQDCAAVCMLGASLSIHEDALPAFQGATLRIAAQDDEAGDEARQRWAKQLLPHARRVESLCFHGLRQVDERPVKDLNDITRIHADDFEQHRFLWALCPAKEAMK